MAAMRRSRLGVTMETGTRLLKSCQACKIRRFFYENSHREWLDCHLLALLGRQRAWSSGHGAGVFKSRPRVACIFISSGSNWHFIKSGQLWSECWLSCVQLSATVWRSYQASHHVLVPTPTPPLMLAYCSLQNDKVTTFS